MPIEKRYEDGVGWRITFEPDRRVERVEVVFAGLIAGLDKRGRVVEIVLTDHLRPTGDERKPDLNRLDNGCMIHRRVIHR
jgi:hypothetical protein